MKVERLYLELAKAIDNSPIVVPCQNTDPEIWFGDKDGGYHYVNLARKLCGMCPAQTSCAAYAIAAVEDHGVWGGLTPKERQRVRNQSQGRPRAA